eukprot:2853807-Prymnesium_polylepis.1
MRRRNASQECVAGMRRRNAPRRNAPRREASNIGAGPARSSQLAPNDASQAARTLCCRRFEPCVAGGSNPVLQAARA